MDDYGNQYSSNEKAQWAKIDDCASGISDLRERSAHLEGRIESVEKRIERQRETAIVNRAEARKEYDTLLAELKELSSSVNQARGGLRVGRFMARLGIGLIAAGVALKAGDMAGVWESMGEAFRG